MNRKDLAIATISWARDEGEEELLRAALGQLATLEIPVFVTDGGSKEGFLRYLRSFPHFTVLTAETKGVWPQAKNSLAAAYNTPASFILYTEPDKLFFFKHSLPSLLDSATGHPNLGVLMASRSAAGFSTFPAFQQMTETTINNCCKEVVGKGVDYTYGPFLLHREVVPHLNGLPDNIGWGWRPYAFSVAHQLGYSVEAYVADFNCPPDQREDDAAERIYRMKQLDQNIQGIVLSTSFTGKREKR